MPSTPVQNEGPDWGTAQVPIFAPVAIVQVPVQQSLSLAHTSPG
jgi:hypothetical protein